MPITMKIKSEQGEVIHLGGDYVQSKPSIFPQRFPLLSGIDPYGNTVFNPRQTERIVREAEALLAEELTDAERSSLVELSGLFALHMRKPHRYLWFVGD